MIMNRNCGRTEFRLRALVCVFCCSSLLAFAVIFAIGSGACESPTLRESTVPHKLAPWVIEHMLRVRRQKFLSCSLTRRT